MGKLGSSIAMIGSIIILIVGFTIVPIGINILEEVAKHEGTTLSALNPDLDTLYSSAFLTILITLISLIGGIIALYRDIDIGYIMVTIMCIFAFIGAFIDLRAIDISTTDFRHYLKYPTMCAHFYFIPNSIMLFGGITGFPLEKIRDRFMNIMKFDEKELHLKKIKEFDEFLGQKIN